MLERIGCCRQGQVWRRFVQARPGSWQNARHEAILDRLSGSRCDRGVRRMGAGAAGRAARSVASVDARSPHRRLHHRRQGRVARLVEGRVADARPARGREGSPSHARQDALLPHRPLRADGRRGQRADRDDERGLPRPVDRGRLRVLPVAGRDDTRSTSSTRSRRSGSSCRSWCRTSAASSTAGARGTTRAPRKIQKAVTVRGGPAEDRRPHHRLDGGSVRAVRPAEAAAERAAEERHPLARQRLPHGLRRRPHGELELGAGPRHLPPARTFGTLVFE